MHCEYFERRRRRRTCYSSTSVEALAQREASIRVSGIICRHISAGHLNCNTWFPLLLPLRSPTATPERRGTDIIQVGFGIFNTGFICARSRAFDVHKRILQRINDRNMRSVRLLTTISLATYDSARISAMHFAWRTVSGCTFFPSDARCLRNLIYPITHCLRKTQISDASPFSESATWVFQVKKNNVENEGWRRDGSIVQYRRLQDLSSVAACFASFHNHSIIICIPQLEYPTTRASSSRFFTESQRNRLMLSEHPRGEELFTAARSLERLRDPVLRGIFEADASDLQAYTIIRIFEQLIIEWEKLREGKPTRKTNARK